jgi:hypothetical protein
VLRNIKTVPVSFALGAATALISVVYLKNRRKAIINRTIKAESAREAQLRRLLEKIEDDNYGY